MVSLTILWLPTIVRTLSAAERGVDVPAGQPAADEAHAKADERPTDDPQRDGTDDPDPEAHPDVDRDLQHVLELHAPLLPCAAVAAGTPNPARPRCARALNPLRPPPHSGPRSNAVPASD